MSRAGNLAAFLAVAFLSICLIAQTPPRAKPANQPPRFKPRIVPYEIDQRGPWLRVTQKDFREFWFRPANVQFVVATDIKNNAVEADSVVLKLGGASEFRLDCVDYEAARAFLLAVVEAK